MFTFDVRNVSEALHLVNQSLKVHGVQRETRNGPALEFPAPVAITYRKPLERVLFYPERDANPFFHFMESLWMLDGNRDVEWVQHYNNRMSVYSDNGINFHGAYGFRWRRWFGEDQLGVLIHRLKTYPNDRRCVLGMWDPNADLVEGNENVDLPCNTHIYFRLEDNKLHMTVCTRSNDMIWGALGANAVHMSYLQEYMASMIDAEVGTYVQFSNNFHAYLETLSKLDGLQPDYHPYLEFPVGPPINGDQGALFTAQEEPPRPFIAKLVDDTYEFEEELHYFVRGLDPLKQRGYSWNNSFFPGVAMPMRTAWREWKKYSATKDGAHLMEAIDHARTIQAEDWRKACYEWLDRRRQKAGFKTLAPEEEGGCASATPEDLKTVQVLFPKGHK